MEPPAPPPENVCSKKKGCDNEALVCAAAGCSKLVCRSCYEVAVVTKNKIPLEEALPEELVACTLKCHRKALKAGTSDQSVIGISDPSDSNQRIPWDTDTANKKYEGSSDALLLDWLKAHGNYARWRGNKRGISKREIQKDIADMINKDGLDNHNINRNRTEAQVASKIRYIEMQFRKTVSFMEHTGQGIREEQNLSTQMFRELVAKRFPPFWDLYDIMSERSSVRPVVRSDDLATDDEDGDEEDGDDDNAPPGPDDNGPPNTDDNFPPNPDNTMMVEEGRVLYNDSIAASDDSSVASHSDSSSSEVLARPSAASVARLFVDTSPDDHDNEQIENDGFVIVDEDDTEEVNVISSPVRNVYVPTSGTTTGRVSKTNSSSKSSRSRESNKRLSSSTNPNSASAKRINTSKSGGSWASAASSVGGGGGAAATTPRYSGASGSVGGGGAAAAATTPRSSGGSAGAATTTPRSKKGNQPIVSGDSVIKFLAGKLGEKDIEQTNSQNKIVQIKEVEAAEVKRHNQAVEELERLKLHQMEELERLKILQMAESEKRMAAVSTVEAARSRMKFNVEVFKEYNTLRVDQPNMPLEDIARISPAFIACFPSSELSKLSEDKKIYIKELYDDWAKEQGLPKTNRLF